MGTSCPELPAAFEKIGKAAPVDARRMHDVDLPRGLELCGCKGVDPAFDFLVIATGAEPRAFGWVPLPARADGAKARTIEELARSAAR